MISSGSSTSAGRDLVLLDLCSIWPAILQRPKLFTATSTHRKKDPLNPFEFVALADWDRLPSGFGF